MSIFKQGGVVFDKVKAPHPSLIIKWRVLKKLHVKKPVGLKYL